MKRSCAIRLLILALAVAIPSCGGNGSPAPPSASGVGGKPSVSQDGRFVVFQTTSPTAENQVVVVDRGNGTTVVINGNEVSNATVTPDGRFVAFDSLPVGSATRQVFLMDLSSNVTTLVSATADGVAGGGDSTNPSVTDDGRFVAFQSNAVDLGAQSASRSSVLIREMASLTILSASSPETGNDVNPVISGNGQFVAFESQPLGGSGFSTVLLWNALSRQLSPVSETPGGVQPNGNSGAPSISGDGRFVAFESRATNLIEASSPAVAFLGESNIFVRDVLTGLLDTASIPLLPGTPANGDSHNPSLSEDARQVAFDSTATNLTADAVVPGESNVFVRDLQTGITTLVTLPATPPTPPTTPTTPETPATPVTPVTVTPVTPPESPTPPTNNTTPTGTEVGTIPTVTPNGTVGTQVGTIPVVAPGNGTGGAGTTVPTTTVPVAPGAAVGTIPTVTPNGTVVTQVGTTPVVPPGNGTGGAGTTVPTTTVPVAPGAAVGTIPTVTPNGTVVTQVGTTPVVAPGNGTAGAGTTVPTTTVPVAPGAAVGTIPTVTPNGTVVTQVGTTPVVAPGNGNAGIGFSSVVAAVAVGSVRPSLSPDGAWVAFESRGQALATTAPSSGTRIFLADLRTRKIAEVGR